VQHAHRGSASFASTASCVYPGTLKEDDANLKKSTLALNGSDAFIVPKKLVRVDSLDAPA